jgi:hypothetical protein
MPSLLTDISEWGPAMWRAMHTVSFCYPASPSAKQRDGYRKFFDSLAVVLPCIDCKTHLIEHYDKYP